MTGYIYKLICPITNEPIYIGSTINSLPIRLSGHMSCSACGTSPIYNYIRENKITPVIELIEEVKFKHRDLNKLRWAEYDQIKMHRERGVFLLNQRPVEIPKRSYNPTIGNFKTLPEDIRSILLEEQYKLIDKYGHKKSSTTIVLINIIREWKQFKSQ